MKQFLEVGEFVTTHGIHGELKVYPWCDSPEFIAQLPQMYLSAKGEHQIIPEQVRIHKGMCIIKLKNVDTIEQARTYIRKILYFNRNDVILPEGRYFVQDLIGCSVQDADSGIIYGAIKNVAQPAANDVYTIQNQSGKEFLFPAVPEFLQSIDLEKKLVLVRPIPGMFDQAENGDA